MQKFTPEEDQANAGKSNRLSTTARKLVAFYRRAADRGQAVIFAIL
jgi:hypothetical protein